MYFQHSGEIWRDFPALVPGVLYADGITSQAEVGARVDRFAAVAKARLTDGPEGELPQIQAWRRAFAQLGLKPTQYRCASESLLRRFRKEGSLPRLHPLVDLCNAVSLAFATPVAVFDAARVTWPLEVRYAAGDEDYLTFGGDTEHPAPGEVIFADQTGLAHARRWTNRQSGLSAVRDSTAAVLIVAEALHLQAASDVRELTATLDAELRAVWSVTPSAALLTPNEPRFTFGAPAQLRQPSYGSPVTAAQLRQPSYGSPVTAAQLRQPSYASPVTPAGYASVMSGSDSPRVNRACSAAWVGFGWPALPR